ncbi:conserved Plasmodium protein, unknown function [Plasmodium berghei]|uniref:Uncharacterized protein n=2 Tax=Plasmodium berghei TaxID=5821 RepID=A0A509AKM0_PLABA|nr:conserved protein, unknown function [Plasmodium berghei ANKA]CXI32851.1 conserved Plasmodium protein, unknown function [Plasmodium berghei]SCM21185.1 conserved Plasmodium protein, unknown function [Plasmodium berghei]SCN24512.1 conserved Plasmodium protein, unknown function [Plasmodium berghei]SCO59691.1 conserved Plasmodium protein, unknown function [Plasmodium berghei]SCO60887.1 conserved Plasmodium protein, unknown function [Plasmodium berghei]|eukprot:XP_034421155.1 conserved protein, unknown function [Plasmodium berghei ANKA]
MDDTTHNKRGLAKIINTFYINWNHRRQNWRVSFYYNCLTIITALNVIFTLIFQHLIKSFDFFINYSCELEHINFVLNGLLIFLILLSFISIFAFFLSRISSIFSNFTINDFMSLGKWMERIGCTVKWFPWALAVFIVFWFSINIFNLITLYATPNLWCKPRINTVATYIVNNCRLYESKTATCSNDDDVSSSKSLNLIKKCNSLDYLKNNNYFAFVPDLNDKNYAQCTFNNINICTLYKSLRNNQQLLEKYKDLKLSGCLNNTTMEIEDFYDKNIHKSDLYKYSEIFTIGSNVIFFIMISFFFFIKRTTQFDGLFYQSIDSSDMFILRILRHFTPWS